MYFRTREDDAWRYQTTSSQYGQFYKAMERETERDKGQHADCSREETQLREQLDEAKACLEMVSLGGPNANQWPYGPRGPCCFEASVKGIPCPCRQKPARCKNPYTLNSLQAWNCGQNPEPQFAEDHVNCYHPPPKPKTLIPKITFGHPKKNGQDYGKQSQASTSLATAVARWECSGGGFGSGGERITQSSPATARGSFYSNRCGSPAQNKGTNVLPDTSRYGFYRYYGFAGQGAKTSKGYRRKR